MVVLGSGTNFLRGRAWWEILGHCDMPLKGIVLFCSTMRFHHDVPPQVQSNQSIWSWTEPWNSEPKQIFTHKLITSSLWGLWDSTSSWALVFKLFAVSSCKFPHSSLLGSSLSKAATAHQILLTLGTSLTYTSSTSWGKPFAPKGLIWLVD
jgi:hypothetical protein